MENQKTGYVPLYRSVLKQSWAKDVFLRTLWENLLLMAARQPYTANFKGLEWDLKPGQLVTTAADLGQQLCDRKGKPASRDAVERMLSVFVRDGMITIAGEQKKGRVITVNNYTEYAQNMSDFGNLPAQITAHKTAQITAHGEPSAGAASGGVAAQITAHCPAQITAHHEQEGNNKNINKTPLTPHGGEEVGQDKPKRRKPAPAIDYDAYLNAYNEEVGEALPHAVVMSATRKRALGKIIDQLKTPNVDGFRAYVRAFVSTAKPFYFGSNDTGWTADLDFLLREKTLTGVREGKFTDTRGAMA
ncbi:replication protein [Klebsiella variicola]|uniref:replication protein n=1 Tax=Klebsiella variicola TaxID=244366 RepID=UPI0039F6CE10